MRIPKQDERTPGPEYWKTREGAAFNAIAELCNPEASISERFEAADILREAIGMPTEHTEDCGINDPELEEPDASDCTCAYWTEPRANKSVNAYGSTDALREALAELLAATDPARGRGSDRELDARAKAVKALSGSPAPSSPSNDLIETLREIEKQCIQADDPGHHTLSLVKHMARNALKGGGSPAPSTEGLREALQNLVDCLYDQGLIDQLDDAVGASVLDVARLICLLDARNAARTALAGVTATSTEAETT